MWKSTNWKRNWTTNYCWRLLNNFEAVILIPRINPIKSKLLPDYQIDWKFSDEKVALKEIENKEVKTFNIK